MFEFEAGRQNGSDERVDRRWFLAAGAAALGGVALFGLRTRETASNALAQPVGQPGSVTLVAFSDDGKRIGTVTVSRVVRTDAAWRKQLTGGAYQITRRADTEMAYSGSTWNNHQVGLYRCICCGTAVFDSATKFESGTGWPSFWQPIAKENIVEAQDDSFGMERTAVLCKRCDAHLGHVFNDGPQPTGLRYCMNSIAMRFVCNSCHFDEPQARS